MKKVILTKLVSTHNNVNNFSMEGSILDLPAEGSRFIFMGDDHHNSLVTTSVLASTSLATITGKKLDYLFFSTKNSTYKLEIKNVQEENQEET